MATTRRNGQLPSCEPCRKSKLRCDHSTPICNRCIRRGRADMCLYHPAPLTKFREVKAAAIRKPRQKLSTSQSVSPAVGDVSVAASPSHTLTIGESQAWEKRPSANPGFLGLTSYSDTVTGYAGVLDYAMRHAVELEPREDGAGSSAASVDSGQMELGAQVLMLLEHLPLFEEIMEKRIAVWEGVIFGPQLFRAMFKTIREVYRNATEGVEDKYPCLLELARFVFQNTATEIVVHASMTLSEYISMVAARWDTLSLLLSSMGYAVYQIPHDDPVFQTEGMPGKDRKGLRRIAMAASDICLQFCDKSGTIGDPLCWATLQQTGFVFHTFGTSDYRTWQKLGDLTTIIFALGLHQVGDNTNIPFFLSEIRKRALVGAYAIDKDLAIFLGRPPRICRRYCNIQYPLDLSHEEMIASPGVRQQALAKLDARGWNKEEKLSKGARGRCVLLSSFIREEILELSLTHPIDDLDQQAEAVLKRAHQWRSDLPSFLHWTADANNPDLGSLHLEFLYQDFLIYQTVAKRTGKKHDSLISTSLEIVSCCLELVSRQMRSLKMHMFTILDLCYVGLPAAGTLATELLRRSQPKPEPASSSAPFPRSEIIQKLSVFISHTDTFIQQHEGDYEIALRGQMLIRQVLDRVLSPVSGPPLSDPLGAGIPMADDMDFMAMLESFDWEQEIRPTLS
ncbi:putative chromatin structure remodeling complex protein RSC3 [Aspergillus clavatus NRRL 1]|uniref:Chromatin structure remodeling complex protein RSC3, putative n=1 Tax=Aspergillus clavatus (strain ATCC 1007 / CBS 513.65 / DSM 816 / NCTC 3887 / NRRL 1 / QM 1276 / 107) TaxID=344612 RepID=A1CCM9_ASPCL|nr:chromatin structure remodeling complex protein RSC3, putative [Aspergillus clavatus NRRL 1]EAW12286.1 chromatin structure remodeling complex protein RSC3, putative [Aspergillus clavatus NRRL 1]